MTVQAPARPKVSVRKQETKKYTQLSAVIMMIFAEQTLRDKNFFATGYDLRKIVRQLRLPFSHQQIYREIDKVTQLTSFKVPQEDKPDKKNYELINKDDDFLLNIQDIIDFNPKRTNPKIFLGFNHLGAATEAYKQAVLDFERFKKAEREFVVHSGNVDYPVQYSNRIYLQDCAEKAGLINQLELHVLNLATLEFGKNKGKRYLMRVEMELPEPVDVV